MPWLRLIFLVAVLTVTSGYKFRCWLFCIDQTGTQNDYVDARDRCREYAQLKLDMALKDLPQPVDDKTRSAKLVTLFSECMASNGWEVPSGKTDAKDKKPEASEKKPEAVAAVAPAKPDNSNAVLSRSAECAFARANKDISSVAAARAKACDIECAERLKAAPDGPRPAACPPDYNPELESAAKENKPPVASVVPLAAPPPEKKPATIKKSAKHSLPVAAEQKPLENPESVADAARAATLPLEDSFLTPSDKDAALATTLPLEDSFLSPSDRDAVLAATLPLDNSFLPAAGEKNDNGMLSTLLGVAFAVLVLATYVFGRRSGVRNALKPASLFARMRLKARSRE